MHIPGKVKSRSSMCPNNTAPSFFLNNMKIIVCKDRRSSVSITALFTFDKIEIQPNSP